MNAPADSIMWAVAAHFQLDTIVGKNHVEFDITFIDNSLDIKCSVHDVLLI